MKKRLTRLAIVMAITLCVLLMFAQAAFATVSVGGETASPQTSGGTSTSSGTGTPSTGAPIIAAGAVGAAMVGAGLMFRRRGK